MNYNKLFLFLQLETTKVITITFVQLANLLCEKNFSDINFIELKNKLYENNIKFFPDFDNNEITFYK